MKTIQPRESHKDLIQKVNDNFTEIAANASIADGKAVTADGKAVAAQSTANTALANAATADGKAVTALANATTADGKAVAAQNAINTANAEIILEVDFLDLTPVVFNCPVAMKFTSQDSEGNDATLNIALNTNMAQYQKLTITPTQIGLITLKGVKL